MIGECKNGNDNIAKKRHDEGWLHIACGIGDISHQYWGDSSAYDAHNEVGGCLLGEFAYTADGKGKNGGKHYTLTEVANEQGRETNFA